VPLPKLPAAAKRAFALDIETTGVNPWDSRLICIGVKNLREPDSPIEVLFDVDEKKLVEKFVNYMKAHEPEVIVGWGIGFDYKFLFYKLMFYRKECKEWFDAEFYDLMDLFRKGTERSIYTLQKPDKLEDAAKYLLQMKKKMTYDELLLAWQRKEYEKIIKYNENDVKIIEGLWLLSQYAMGRFPELKIEEV
jgi:DNA polymerase elongation subunit (family B)